jgi:hypothetical protein
MASKNIFARKQVGVDPQTAIPLKEEGITDTKDEIPSVDSTGVGATSMLEDKPYSSVDRAETNINEQIELGNELAVKFKEQGVHPILLFGSQMSGKTSLLLSLLNYPRLDQQAEASIEYDDTIYDQEQNVKLRAALEAGQALFYRAAQQWIGNAAPKATLDEHPFFVPVVLQKSSGEQVKFAFLEGRGEWYTPDETNIRPYRKFKGLIQGFLQTFSNPITVLYVAPYVAGSYGDAGHTSGNAELMQKSDLGLVGALEEYVSTRRGYFREDYHILTMTKWDIKCGSVTSDPFLDPRDNEVSDELSSKFPLAWNKFNAMPMSNQPGNLKINAYCAGVMDGARLNQLPSDDKYSLNRYPRKLWDRIHSNAGHGVLYKDVQKKPKSLIDKLLDALRS